MPEAPDLPADAEPEALAGVTPALPLPLLLLLYGLVNLRCEEGASWDSPAPWDGVAPGH